MDRFEQLATSAQILSVIFGRPETNELYVLEEPVPECVTQGLTAQGMRFCGYMAIVDGVGRSAFAEDFSNDVVDGLSRIFLQQVNRNIAARLSAGEREQARVEAAPKDDFTAWASALYGLEDPRPN
jgi:hypothetical protein